MHDRYCGSPPNSSVTRRGLLTLACLTMMTGVALAPAAAAQRRANTLSAQVLDPTGSPVAGAAVEVVPPEGGERHRATTGADGKFTIGNLTRDRYRVVVTSPRWMPVTVTIDLSQAVAEPLALSFRSLALTESVTVTATGTARDTDAVPGEVSVIEREAFDKAQARAFDDVLRYEPGIETGSTRRLMQTPTIRGFDASNVLILRDGARAYQFTSAHKGSLFLDVNDVERVEVVRGPASALYGSGAIGGVVSIKSREPRDLLRAGETVGGTVSAMYSSAYDELMVSPRAYGATPEGLGFVVGYTGRRNDGLVDVAGDVGQLDAAEEDINAFDGRLVAPIGRNGNLRISFNSYAQNGRSSVNLANTIVPADEQVQRSTRQQIFQVVYDSAGDGWWHENLSANAYYSAMHLDEKRPLDGRVDRIELSTWGFDARNAVALGSGQQLTYGLELFRDRENSARDAGVNDLFPPGRQTQAGLYAQDEISAWNGRWVIVPGLRWDHWSSSADTTASAGRTDSRFNPKVGTSVEIGGGLVATASYGEGFRAPNFQELFISGTHFKVPLGPGVTLLGIFTPNPDLAPETSRNVDVGLRFRNRRLSARVAWYHAWVGDFIDFEVTEGFRPPGTVLLTFTNRNVLEATLYGLEAALRWDLDVNWTLRANYSKPRGADTATGKPLGTVPPAKTVLGGEFREPGRGLVLGVDARVIADDERVPEGVDPVTGYALFDMYSAWTPAFWPHATLRFNIFNIGDRAYRVPLFGVPGTGRDFRFGVAIRFGQ